VGEVCVGVAFGVLPVLGSEYVQRGELSLAIGWLGLPAGLLVAAILEINEFPDIAADASVGKRTVVVRLGRRRAVMLYAALVAAAYLAVAVGVAMGWMPWLSAIVLLVAPLSWRAVSVLRAHSDDVRALLPAMAATIGQEAAFLILLTGAYVADGALRAW
jgi:1,4-dihydroxy-2-naphthoate octaprenyltransferase